MQHLAWIAGGAVAAVLVGIGVGFVVAEVQAYFEKRKRGNNEDDN